jgi:hypothetical protein
MKRNKILNLAYGSNLNLGQMAYRCPTAKVYGKGMLLDYQLLFKGREDNAYATIEPKRGSKVRCWCGSCSRRMKGTGLLRRLPQVL